MRILPDSSIPSHSPLKLLVCAYACNPMQGSEEGVGWGWVCAMAERHVVTVLTADFNRPDIERGRLTLDNSTQRRLSFTYVKNRPWHYRPGGLWSHIANSGAKPLMNLAYQNWLQYAFHAAQGEMAVDQYDIFHLLTYVGWRFPGRFHQLDLPFVWGPIGGLLNTPVHLLPGLGRTGAVYHSCRNAINSTQRRILRGPRRALRKANGAVIAATRGIQRELQRSFGSASTVVCEIGSPSVQAPSVTPRKAGSPLQICWSGRLSECKALHLLLRAAALLPADIDYTIHIVGDGPQKASCHRLAKQLNIDCRCHWHGQLLRSDAFNVMASSHVFAITSLHDLTSTVCVEALSLALPIVCIDHCGFAELVDETCGTKIPPTSIGSIIRGFSQAIAGLYADDALRCRLAEGALLRSAVCSWDAKMTALEGIYGRALGDRVQHGRPV